MLVLTRKPNETIVINNDTEITVLQITGNKVRLGIKAPTTVPIVRKELNDYRNQWHATEIELPMPSHTLMSH